MMSSAWGMFLVLFLIQGSDVIRVWKEVWQLLLQQLLLKHYWVLIVITHLPTSETTVDQSVLRCCWKKITKTSFSRVTPQLRNLQGLCLVFQIESKFLPAFKVPPHKTAVWLFSASFIAHTVDYSQILCNLCFADYFLCISKLCPSFSSHLDRYLLFWNLCWLSQLDMLSLLVSIAKQSVLLSHLHAWTMPFL